MPYGTLGVLQTVLFFASAKVVKKNELWKFLEKKLCKTKKKPRILLESMRGILYVMFFSKKPLP